MALQKTKTAVQIRIGGAEKLKTEELLSKAKQHMEGASAIHQMRNNDNKVLVQSASQGDTVLDMRQAIDFQISKQDFSLEIFGVPLRTRIEGGRDAVNHAIIAEIETATGAWVGGLAINRIRWLHCGHRGPNQSSVSTAVSGNTGRRRVKRWLGAVYALVLTKLGTVRGKRVLSANCSR